MKKAFTVMELIFVIIVMGILAAIIVPRLERNPVAEAGIQLLSHVRYTQHLAMVDDRYQSDTNDTWYKSKWQIMFEKSTESGGKDSYTIFSDNPGYSGHAGASEIATNPEDKAKRLTGGTNGVDINNPAVTPSMNLGNKYGVSNLIVTGGTSSTAKRIYFDNLGRPYKTGTTTLTSPTAGLANSPIFIKICANICSGDNNKSSNESELVIRIENETGFSCILAQNSDTNCL